MATTQQTGMGYGTTTALHSVLAHVTQRLRLARWLRTATRGALIAVSLSLLAVGLDHWHLLPPRLSLVFLIPLLLLLGISIGSLIAFLHPIDPMAAARLAEDRLGLKERLSSALEFERAVQTPRDPEAALLFRLQQEDAAACARDLRPAAAVPIRLPWEAKALIPAVVLLLLALILPALPIFLSPAVRNERAVVQKAGTQLQRDARVIEKRADAQGLPQTKHTAQEMQKLGQRMAQGSMDKKQAMVQQSQLSKQMADEQRRLAQANSQTGQGGQNLSQAGQQLTQSLSQPAKGQNSPQSSGTAGQKTGQTRTEGQQSAAATPEIQKAGQSLKQNDTSGLSRQLRDLAQRTASGRMPPADQQKAAQDVQKLADALKDTPLTETQQHTQAAADALKHGDTRRAADEMRHAADATDHQAQQQADAQGVQDAQQTLQRGQQQMAQASKPSDIPDESRGGIIGQSKPGSQQGQSGQQSQQSQTGQQGQKQGSQGQTGQGGQQGQHGSGSSPGQGQHSGTGSGQSSNPGQGNPTSNGNGSSPQGGAPSNGGSGDGKSAAARPGSGHYTPESGSGEKTPGHDTGIVRGAPHPLDPKFDPKKNPTYGKIYLGAGDGTGGGKTVGKLTKAKPGTPSKPGQPLTSSVPYYNTLAPARKSAETTMDKEDIPPSYRSDVRRYFDALQPPSGKPAK